jgi:hypothetical protein
MNPPAITFVSGIGPGPTGTGALMIGLMEEARPDPSAKFLFKIPRGSSPWGLLKYVYNRASFAGRVRRATRSAETVVLLHPQTIGFRTFAAVVESRPVTWMYVLDSFTFCVRSYNCLVGEATPCLRCLGNDGAAAAEQGCVNWFRSGPFHAHLPQWVQSGRLRLMAQCESHARLLRAHFGPQAIIHVVPLSVPDVEVPAAWAVRPARPRPLVVFHGACYPAKGVDHVVALARLMPECDFLIPSDEKEFIHHFGAVAGLPTNITFRRMSWARGLAEAVATADLVLCPSSWSATVEGAVLKSLAHNGLVGLFAHETAFASEVPVDARLDLNPSNWPATVERLRAALADSAQATAIRSAARAYITRYLASSRDMLSQIRAVCRSSEGSGPAGR